MLGVGGGGLKIDFNRLENERISPLRRGAFDSDAPSLMDQ